MSGRDFHEVSALLDYPMFVVTTAHDGVNAGCLVGFATQASIDPPRFLVGLSDKNNTYRVALRASRLVVHLLDSASTELAELFGAETGDDVDKFDNCGWQPGPGGVPILDDAAAWFSGPVSDQLTMGDHTGFLIEVDASQLRNRPARLLSFSAVRDLDPGHDA